MWPLKNLIQGEWVWLSAPVSSEEIKQHKTQQETCTAYRAGICYTSFIHMKFYQKSSCPTSSSRTSLPRRDNASLQSPETNGTSLAVSYRHTEEQVFPYSPTGRREKWCKKFRLKRKKFKRC
jgi:hypothetical protein